MGSVSRPISPRLFCLRRNEPCGPLDSQVQKIRLVLVITESAGLNEFLKVSGKADGICWFGNL